MLRQTIVGILLALLIIDANGQQNTCQLPIQWNGLWYQNKHLDLLPINRTHFVNKGLCIQSKQDKYLFFDSKELCYRCVFVMQKHYNVLQFRASYCSDQNDFNYNCGNLSPESELVTIYRENAIPEKCPLNDLHSHTKQIQSESNCTTRQPYSSSNIMQCADQTMLKLEFDKCTTTLSTFAMNCIAHWTEGNTNYLIGRMHSELPNQNVATSAYRCLIYTETNPDTNRNMRRYNQNEDETFVELLSPYATTEQLSNKIQLTLSQDEFCRNIIDNLAEDQNTFTFVKSAIIKPDTNRKSLQASSSHQQQRKCRFPKWFNKRWNNMKATKIFTVDYKFETLLVLDEKNSLISSKFTCAHVRSKRTTSFQAIVRTLNGCNTGYQCVTITSRSDFAAEIRFGKVSSSIAFVDCNDYQNSELIFVDTSIGVPCPFNGNIYDKHYENPNANDQSPCKYLQSQILQIGCQNTQQYSLKTKLCYKKAATTIEQEPSTSITQLESEINLICLAYWYFNDYVVLMSKTMTNDVLCSVWLPSKDDATLKLYEIDANCNYQKRSLLKLTFEFKKLYRCSEQQSLMNRDTISSSSTSFQNHMSIWTFFFGISFYYLAVLLTIGNSEGFHQAD